MLKVILILWLLAGFAFWAIYQAKSFPQYPFGTMGLMGVCLFAGPLSWLALLITI